MKRREFITLLGGAAAAWPLAALAQEPGRIYRLAILSQSGGNTPQMLALFDELRRVGFIEHQNLKVDPNFDVRSDQLAERAAAIVKAAPDVILAVGEVVTRAAQGATRTVPIVGAAEDMVAAGLVDSLARPGGNTTGSSLLSLELDGKRQDILLEAVPGARRMTVLADSNVVTTTRHLQFLQDASRARGVEASIYSVSKPEDIVSAIHSAKAWRADAISVLASPMLSANRRILFVSVAAVRLPAIYQWPEMAEEGGLMAYGPRLTQWYRQRAQTLVKVLRGAKPADIPIEQPTHFELVINLQTAKAIGHEVPAGLVLRADKVIE
jgi:putative ABC transport system substrate-binding protein